MTVAHDVFAETNPAFCAAALAAFTESYTSVNNEGPEILNYYIALPIALSGNLAGTFDGTNKRTGLLEWLSRSPEVQVGLASRVNSSLNIVTSAVRFGCFAQVLVLNKDGRASLGVKALNKNVLGKLQGESARALKRAERLGFWFAMAGSTRTAFDMMDLTV